MTTNIVSRLLSLSIVSLAITLGGCSKESTPSAGEQVFSKTCKVCHAQGLNGAPILGNKKMWGPRVSQGVDVLVQHATNGFRLMPAKGGNEALTEEDIKAAVNFMVSQVN